MADKIRWGLLSTARINNALIDPIRQAERSELVAVASRDRAKAEAYAKEKGIATAHGSYEALLADPDVDVIYISLPNQLHAEWTVQAAEAGKHVLCEKPLVTTLEDFERVEAAAQANHVTIFEAFMYLHHPQTRQIKEIIDDGRLGRLQTINSWFAFYLPPENSQNVRLQSELHGGSLWDVGVYPNSLAIVMNGAAPVEVWAQQVTGEESVDVYMMAQLRFGNGSSAQISSGFRSPPRQGTQIVGDRAKLDISEPWKPWLGNQQTNFVLTTVDNEEERIMPPQINPYLCEVQAMEACILDGAEPVVPLSLSRDFLRSILAIYESARTGQPVTL